MERWEEGREGWVEGGIRGEDRHKEEEREGWREGTVGICRLRENMASIRLYITLAPG